MQEFLNEVMGKKILITMGEGEIEDFSLSVVGNIVSITNDGFIIGDNFFSLQIGKMCEITKEDDIWIIKTSKKNVILISILDKIR